MKTVKLLTNLGSIEFPEHRFLEGEEHEVDDSFGERLVRRKLAVDITPPPAVVGEATEPELKAVPEEAQSPAKPHASAKPKKQGE